METAKSKLFRIAEHNFYSSDEIEQIKVLNQAYKAQVYSLNQFMRHEFFIPASQAGGLPLEFVKKEQELDQATLAENKADNAIIAKIREEFMEERVKELEMRVTREKLAKEQELAEEASRVDEYIKDLKSNPDSFVTADNIEALIDKAMDRPITYEFAIDITGNKVTSLRESKFTEKL